MEVNYDDLHFTECSILKWAMTDENTLTLKVSKLSMVKSNGNVNTFEKCLLTFYSILKCTISVKGYKENSLDLNTNPPYVISILNGECLMDSQLYFVEGVDVVLNSWTEWDICGSKFTLEVLD